MADLDDIDPSKITIPADDPGDGSSDADPEAAAEADQDDPVGDESRGDLSDDDPNKTW